MNDRPLFVFEHVGVDVRGSSLVRDVCAEVPPHGITVIVGPSGSGKSTMLRLCNRLEVPTRGRVYFRGDDVAAIDPLALRRRVGMVFQRPTPFGGTGLDNLRVARPDLDAAEAARALRRVGLGPGFLDRAADDLSGGEAQRLCIARTLVTEPEVLLLDEPTAALDPAARSGLEELGRGLAEQGVPMLWVSHDLSQVRRVADHVLVLLVGTVAHSAPVERLLDDAPSEARAFLDGEAP